MSKEQIAFFKTCTVRVNISQGHGTGFFVAPGLVVTCRHVIGELADEQQLVLRWGKQNFSATIKRTVKTADLALLQLNEPLPDHPCVFLVGDLEIHDSLYCYGYPDNFVADSATFRFEGPCEDENEQEMLKLKEGQARSGFSGSPLLNFRTGRVCGVVYRSRDIDTDLGGRAIPTDSVFSAFDGLADLQRTYHRDHPRWKRTFFAIDPSFKERSFTLPETIDWIAWRFKTQVDNKQRDTLDFTRHIQEDISLCSLTPEEAVAEVEHWVLEIEKSSNDPTDLARALLFRNSFREAAELSRKAGENKLAPQTPPARATGNI